VFAVAWSGRDFGPMLAAERNARTNGVQAALGQRNRRLAAELEQMNPDPDAPRRARNALVPIGVLVVAVLVSLWATGRAAAGDGAGLREIVGASDSYRSLLWASLLAVVVALVMTRAQRLMSVEDALDAWFTGLKAVMPAMIIL